MEPSLRRAALLAGLAAAVAWDAGGGGVPDPSQDAPAGMVLVPAGEFTMGRTFSTTDDETGMRPLVLRDDLPAHKVALEAYWMDITEATQEEYAEFVAATGHRAPYHWLGGEMPGHAAKHPVHNVDWDDARSYCEWRGKRLPTEAEWERAARGGAEGERYPWGDGKPNRDKARYATQLGPSAVAQHPPNEFGLHDMAGGVAEWCQDWFDRTYYSVSPPAGPRGPDDGTYKIIRGGAWSDGPNRITVFFRNWVRPNQRTPNLGFRCVKDAP